MVNMASINEHSGRTSTDFPLRSARARCEGSGEQPEENIIDAMKFYLMRPMCGRRYKWKLIRMCHKGMRLDHMGILIIDESLIHRL